MPSVTGTSLAILGSGAISGGTSLISGLLGSNAAQNAAQLQSNAAMYAANIQRKEFEQIRRSLRPYIQMGDRAVKPLDRLLGIGPGENPLHSFLGRPLPQWHPTMQQLAKTPGYQFALNQGLQATQNSFAAQGLGQSGAALKGADQFAQGLASTTYQQQFQNFITQQQLKLAQRQQIFGNLSGVVGMGQSAAMGQGQLGMGAASNIGSDLMSGAAAGAAGIVGGTNAITNSLGGLAGAGSNTALLMALNQAGLFSNPSQQSGGEGSLPFS